MTDERPPPALEDLDARLREARRGAGLDPPPGQGEMGLGQGYGLGVRIGVELVAGVVVGLILGLAIDRWFGTAPWGLVILFLLGACAGILNVYRAVTGQGHAIGYGTERLRSKERGKGSEPGSAPTDRDT